MLARDECRALIRGRRRQVTYGTAGKMQMPMEVMWVVVGYLEKEEWAAVAHTCRQWRGWVGGWVRPVGGGAFSPHTALFSAYYPTAVKTRQVKYGRHPPMGGFLVAMYCFAAAVPGLAFIGFLHRALSTPRAMGIDWSTIVYILLTPFFTSLGYWWARYATSLISHALRPEVSLYCTHRVGWAEGWVGGVVRGLTTPVDSAIGRIPSPLCVGLFWGGIVVPMCGVVEMVKTGEHSVLVDVGYVVYAVWFAVGNWEWAGDRDVLTPFACLGFFALCWCDGLGTYLEGRATASGQVLFFKMLAGVSLASLGISIYSAAPRMTPTASAFHALMAATLSIWSAQSYSTSVNPFPILALTLSWSALLYLYSPRTAVSLFSILSQPALISLTALSLIGPLHPATTLYVLFLITVEILPCVTVGLIGLELEISLCRDAVMAPWPLKDVRVVEYLK